MARPENELNARQEALLAALLVAPSVSEAARIAGIPEKTARRYLALPYVHRAWLDRRREVVDSAMTGVQLATRAAVATLLDCLKPKYPAAVRVRAAATLLETALRSVEIGDLAARIEELETALADAQESQQRGMRRYA